MSLVVEQVEGDDKVRAVSWVNRVAATALLNSLGQVDSAMVPPGHCAYCDCLVVFGQFQK